MLVYAKEFGFEEPFIPVLYLVFTSGASLFSLPFGKLADRMSRKFVLILFYLLWGLVCLGFVYVESYIEIVFLFALYGLHRAALEPVQRTFVSEVSPTKHRASMLGAFQMTVGLCALPASVIAGFVWIIFGKLTPFYVSLALTSLAIVLMLFVEE